MKGKNPQRPEDLAANGTLALTEKFYTLQGEGPFTGMPALFVRLWGCNLACTFCDTEFEKLDTRYRPAELLEWASLERGTRKSRPNLIVITGGEPLRQNIWPFVHAAHKHGFVVQIETSGSLGIPEAATQDLTSFLATHFVVSPKLPKLHPQILELFLQGQCALKLLVKAKRRSDASKAMFVGMTPELYAYDPGELRPSLQQHVFVQPLDEGDEDKNYANRLQAARVSLERGYRLSLQVHKMVELR